MNFVHAVLQRRCIVSSCGCLIKIYNGFSTSTTCRTEVTSGSVFTHVVNWSVPKEITSSEHDRISPLENGSFRRSRKGLSCFAFKKIAPCTWERPWCLCPPRRVPNPWFQIVCKLAYHVLHLHAVTMSMPKVLLQVVFVWLYNLCIQHPAAS